MRHRRNHTQTIPDAHTPGFQYINTFIIPLGEWHVTGTFPGVVYYAEKTNEWILSIDCEKDSTGKVTHAVCGCGGQAGTPSAG
jgi:hypothetical protein